MEPTSRKKYEKWALCKNSPPRPNQRDMPDRGWIARKLHPCEEEHSPKDKTTHGGRYYITKKRTRVPIFLKSRKFTKFWLDPKFENMWFFRLAKFEICKKRLYFDLKTPQVTPSGGESHMSVMRASWGVKNAKKGPSDSRLLKNDTKNDTSLWYNAV